MFTKVKIMSPLKSCLSIWEVLKFSISIQKPLFIPEIANWQLWDAYQSRDLFWPKQSLDFLKIGINWQQLEIKRFPNWICDLSEKNWKVWQHDIHGFMEQDGTGLGKDRYLLCREPAATIKSFMWSAPALGGFELVSLQP